MMMGVFIFLETVYYKDTWATHLFLRNTDWMTVFTFSKVTLLSEYTSTFGGFILV